MGCLIRLAFVAVIVGALAFGACTIKSGTAGSEQPMDGSTAGANAVTLEDLGIDREEVPHANWQGE